MGRTLEQAFEEELLKLPQPEVESALSHSTPREKQTPLPAPSASLSSRRRHSQRTVRPPPRDLPGSDARKSKDLRSCQKIIKELFDKKHADYAWPFYQPVDVEGLKLDDYFDIVEHPMDLGTIKKKVDTGQYDSIDSFADDVRLVFSNCYKYNPPTMEVVTMAQKLQQVQIFCFHVYASFYTFFFPIPLLNPNFFFSSC